jgi:hypothetical protein
MLLGFLEYISITIYIFLVLYYFLTKRYSKSYSFVDRLLAAFVFGISQILITEIVLGFALQLVSLNLFLLNLGISTLILVLAGISRQEISRQLKEIREKIAALFTTLLRHKILALLFILCVIQVAWWSFQVYLFPPYTWDALWFHLPKVAYAVQSGGIEIFPVGDAWVNTYPYNSELLSVWNVIYLGNDILINGTQIAFALCAVIAIYGIARKVGVKPHNALYAMIFLFVPIVIQQVTTSYTDIIISSLLIVAVNFLLARDKPKVNLLIIGATIGIILGSKYLFILPSLLISLILLLLILWEVKRENNTKNYLSILFHKRFLGDIGLYLVPVLFLGGVWYIRNLILFGNPVAPITVTIFGQTLFAGPRIYTDLVHDTKVLVHIPTLINVWLERVGISYWNEPYYSYVSGRGGFGPMFPILLLPGIVLSIIFACKRRARRYLLISVIFILAFLVVPLDWWSRYTMFFCGFGILSFTVIMEYSEKPKTIALITLPVIILTLMLGTVHFFYTPGNVSDFINRPLSERQSPDFLALHWPSYTTEMYQELWREPGDTILYTDAPHNWNYALWNSDFSNNVIRIPRFYKDYETFIDYIQEFGKSQIVTTDGTEIIRYYRDHPSEFQVIHQQDNWWVISYTGDNNDQED